MNSGFFGRSIILIDVQAMTALNPDFPTHPIRCCVADLGIVTIPEAERIMGRARDLRAAGQLPDLLLFMAHPPTVALGLRDRHEESPKDLLVKPQRLQNEGIQLTRSVRGGGITYHWPGQIVCYPVLSLRPEERDVRGYLWKLEQVAVETLAEFGVRLVRRRGRAAYIGLWLDDLKVVSMGVRISNWITGFGFAVNLEGNHAASSYIRPCGIEGAKLATVEEILGSAPARRDVIRELQAKFASIFNRSLESLPVELHHELMSPGCSE